MKFEELSGREKEENSAEIRNRVEQAHKIQRKRYEKESFSYNSQIPAARVAEFCSLSEDQTIYMERIYNKLNLTARSYHKILKVAADTCRYGRGRKDPGFPFKRGCLLPEYRQAVLEVKKIEISVLAVEYSGSR